jgi:hypothetical protein
MNRIDKNSFWRWAHSDFLSNAQRGVLAEYIVGMALNCLKDKRLEWDAHDLVTNDGIKIEVKSAAYVQSWDQKKLSDIRFDIGRKQSWFAETNTFNNKRDRIADVYVFCVLAEKDRKKIDPLDISQWFFIVLPSETINNKFGNQKTVGLSTLERIRVRQVSFQELKTEIKRSIDKQQ